MGGANGTQRSIRARGPAVGAVPAEPNQRSRNCSERYAVRFPTAEPKRAGTNPAACLLRSSSSAQARSAAEVHSHPLFLFLSYRSPHASLSRAHTGLLSGAGVIKNGVCQTCSSSRSADRSAGYLEMEISSSTDHPHRQRVDDVDVDDTPRQGRLEPTASAMRRSCDACGTRKKKCDGKLPCR